MVTRSGSSFPSSSSGIDFCPPIWSPILANLNKAGLIFLFLGFVMFLVGKIDSNKAFSWCKASATLAMVVLSLAWVGVIAKIEIICQNFFIHHPPVHDWCWRTIIFGLELREIWHFLFLFFCHNKQKFFFWKKYFSARKLKKIFSPIQNFYYMNRNERKMRKSSSSKGYVFFFFPKNKQRVRCLIAILNFFLKIWRFRIQNWYFIFSNNR